MQKYIITDPCYLIPSEDWKECFNEDDFNDLSGVEEYLGRNTGSKAFVSSTGYGDWTNRLFGPHIIGEDSDSGTFTADAGLVCICRYTPDMESYIQTTHLPETSYCVFEAAGNLDVVFDTTDPEWTTVYIKDEDGVQWVTLGCD